ncbi:hypothetical protein D3C74_505850 [compost metagenome]
MYLNPALFAGKQGLQTLGEGERHGAGGEGADQQQGERAAGEREQPGQRQTHHEPCLIHWAI